MANSWPDPTASLEVVLEPPPRPRDTTTRRPSSPLPSILSSPPPPPHTHCTLLSRHTHASFSISGRSAFPMAFRPRPHSVTGVAHVLSWSCFVQRCTSIDRCDRLWVRPDKLLNECFERDVRNARGCCPPQDLRRCVSLSDVSPLGSRSRRLGTFLGVDPETNRMKRHEVVSRLVESRSSLEQRQLLEFCVSSDTRRYKVIRSEPDVTCVSSNAKPVRFHTFTAATKPFFLNLQNQTRIFV